jgi:hypothetical protein
MAASTPTTPPPGVNLDLWGPKVFPGGKLYVFKGKRHLVPTSWKNVDKMMKELKYVEKLEWAYALPHQRQELFNRHLEVLTKNLPINWSLVLCAVASGLIIIVGVVSTVQAKIAKL